VGGSTHAWCQIYLPGSGWVEFDPTNGIVGNRDLIRVGVARDPKQAIQRGQLAEHPYQRELPPATFLLRLASPVSRTD